MSHLVFILNFTAEVMETMTKELVKAEETIRLLNGSMREKQAEIHRLSDLRTMHEVKLEQMNQFSKKLLAVNEKLVAHFSNLTPGGIGSARPFAIVNVNKKVPAPKTAIMSTASSREKRNPVPAVKPSRQEPLSDAALYYQKVNEALAEEFDKIRFSKVESKPRRVKTKKTLISNRKSSMTSEPAPQHVTVIHVPEARSTVSVDDFGSSSPIRGSPPRGQQSVSMSYEGNSLGRADVSGVIASLEEEYDALNAQYKHLVQAVKRHGDTAQASEMIATLQRLQRKEEQIRQLRGES